MLNAAAQFDLVVIDEAHGIFAGLHKRYRRDGLYDEESDASLMSHSAIQSRISSPSAATKATHGQLL